MSETSRLIQKRDGNETANKSSVRQKRAFCTLLPSLLLLYSFIGITSYSVNEWTQQKCKLEYFGNLSSEQTKQSCLDVNETLTEKDNHDKVQHDTSLWNLYYKLAAYIPMLLSSSVLPSLSDAYGRKFLITITSFGILQKAIVSTTVIYFNASPWYIVMTYAIEGITGGVGSFSCVCFSIAADLTSLDQRIVGVVVVEMMAYLGVTFASLLSGLMIETWSLGFVYTGVICSSVGFFACLVVTCLLPETLADEKKRKMSILEAIKRPFKFYFSSDFKGKRLAYVLLLLTVALCSFSSAGRSDIEIIYLLGRPFCWGPAFLGYYITARHGAGSIVGMICLKLLMKCFSNEHITLMAITSTLGSYVLEGFAQSTWTLYMVAAVSTLSLLSFPMIRGIMSTITSPDKQGSIFASVSIIESIANLLGSTFISNLYAQTVSVWPGLVFEGLACFCLINFVTMCLYMFVTRKKEKYTIVDEYAR